MIEFILITILGLLLGYREVQILIERGSWNAEDYRNWFWQTDYKTKWKDFDSFHFSNGLAVLVISAGYYAFDLDLFNIPQILEALNTIAQVIALWVYIFYIRNLMMSVIMKIQPEWKYLLPVIGKYIFKGK